jgi:sulfur carrier protein ThiS
MFEKKKNKKTEEKDILVKVGRVGAEVKEIALNGDRTIKKALAVVGFVKKNSEIVQVNGKEEDNLDKRLSNGDRVILTKNVQGGLN